MRLALLVAATGLVGCMVGPDYRTPTPGENAGSISSAGTADAEAAGIASGVPVVRDWWRTLEDPELERLVDRLAAQNLDVQTASARVREARAQRGVAVSPLYPSLTLDGQVFDQGSGDQFHSSMSYHVGLDATWELDVWGGLRRGVEAADCGIDFAVEARRDALVTALAELGRDYLQLRASQRQLEIARRNVSLQEKSLELVQIRKKAGLASDLEIAQARSLLESTRATIPAVEQVIAQTEFRISVLLGREPQTLVGELSTPGPIPSVPPRVPVGLSSELLVRRPDIRKAERNMEIACANVGIATADLYPRFALTAEIAYANVAPGKVAGAPEFFVGPTVTWPIFNGFKIVSNIAVADARLEQAVLGYRSAILLALQDVESSIAAYAKEKVRREVLQRAAAEAEKAEGLAQIQYKNGLVDFLNVINAQSTLSNAQQALVLSEQTLLTDLIAVYKALGGGWDVFEVDLAERELRPADTELPK